MTAPVIAVTPGDCTGIGPEILAKLLARARGADDPRLLVVGDRRVMERACTQTGAAIRWQPVASPAEARWDDRDAVPILDLGNTDPALFRQGVASAESGRLTGDTLARAVELSQAGTVAAVSFAPLNKRAMFDGGWRFPDEHKMFAHLLGHTRYFSEMNVLEGWWMSRVTSHVSMREALDGVTGPAIRDAIRLCDRMMRRSGLERPRIAVAALNPHGGENGLFGREEIEVIRPAVEATAREDGIDCQGPFPADTVYVKAFGGAYDGVVAMYHDQGQIATKLRGFNRGVTVTAGLETVFTTPAHGTAFDIAGKGTADEGALGAAIALAARLVGAKPN